MFECSWGFKECRGQECSNFLGVGIAKDKCLHDVSTTNQPAKPIVFSSGYDAQYAEYLQSLGEQTEPETIEPNELESSGRFGAWVLVGHGEITGKSCGSFLHFAVCPHHELHALNQLNGVSFGGKTYIHYVFHHCNKPSCPVCYKRGWACREAEKIAQRIREASKTLGLAEHCVISVPKSDYGLKYASLKAKVIRVAQSRGIIAGVLIFHAFRYRKYEVINGGIRNMRGWYFSPHFHIIGFVLGGYGKCRNCPKMKPYEYKTASGRVVKKVGNDTDCKNCDGFEHVVRKLAWGDNLKPKVDPETGAKVPECWTDLKGKRHKGDGYIVKVQEKRNTIFGTAWYQLNHSSLIAGSVRFHVETWFGACSYRRMKLTAEFKNHLECKICGSPLIAARYIGRDLFHSFDCFCTCDKIVDLNESDSLGNSFLAWIPIVESGKKQFSHSEA